MDASADDFSNDDDVAIIAIHLQVGTLYQCVFLSRTDS